MTNIALIAGGKVANVLTVGTGWESVFPDAVTAGEGVKIGMLYDGQSFTAPAPAELGQPDLLSYAALKRYEAEVGGTTVFGFPLRTGREDRTLIYEAEASANADAGFATTWIAADGTAHDLSAEMVFTLAAAARTHVAACFGAYATVAAEIAAGTITTMAEIDAAPWPAKS